MAAPRQPAEKTFNIKPFEQEEIDVHIVGNQPMFLNRMSEKVKQILLLGSTPKTRADKLTSIKHDPIEEFRGSCYVAETEQTALVFPASALKSAITTTAADTPGVTMTSIKRLVRVSGEMVPLFGVPYLRMDVVRNDDASRTPDIRTRAFLPTWGLKIAFTYIRPHLKSDTITNLIANSGLTVGIGDFRQEKGKGSFGTFDIVSPDDKRWINLVENHGKAAQQKALENPIPMGLETESLLVVWSNWRKSR